MLEVRVKRPSLSIRSPQSLSNQLPRSFTRPKVRDVISSQDEVSVVVVVVIIIIFNPINNLDLIHSPVLYHLATVLAMSYTHPDAVPSAPNPASASADVSMFTNTDPETRDDSGDPWRFEVSPAVIRHTS